VLIRLRLRLAISQHLEPDNASSIVAEPLFCAAASIEVVLLGAAARIQRSVLASGEDAVPLRHERNYLLQSRSLSTCGICVLVNEDSGMFLRRALRVRSEESARLPANKLRDEILLSAARYQEKCQSVHVETHYAESAASSPSESTLVCPIVSAS